MFWSSNPCPRYHLQTYLLYYFLRKFHAVFHSGCTSLHFHQHVILMIRGVWEISLHQNSGHHHLIWSHVGTGHGGEIMGMEGQHERKPQEKWVELKEEERGGHQGHSLVLTLVHCLQNIAEIISITWHASLCIINTIGWGQPKAPMATNSQGETRSKGNIGRSSNSLMVSNVLGFPKHITKYQWKEL